MSMPVLSNIITKVCTHNNICRFTGTFLSSHMPPNVRAYDISGNFLSGDEISLTTYNNSALRYFNVSGNAYVHLTLAAGDLASPSFTAATTVLQSALTFSTLAHVSVARLLTFCCLFTNSSKFYSTPIIYTIPKCVIIGLYFPI